MNELDEALDGIAGVIAMISLLGFGLLILVGLGYLIQWLINIGVVGQAVLILIPVIIVVWSWYRVLSNRFGALYER